MRDIPPDTVFQVQFSKDMEESSFKERVVFRYAGRPQPGDNALDAVRVSYDGGLRTLRVDPGDISEARAASWNSCSCPALWTSTACPRDPPRAEARCGDRRAAIHGAAGLLSGPSPWRRRPPAS